MPYARLIQFQTSTVRYALDIYQYILAAQDDGVRFITKEEICNYLSLGRSSVDHLMPLLTKNGYLRTPKRVLFGASGEGYLPVRRSEERELARFFMDIDPEVYASEVMLSATELASNTLNTMFYEILFKKRISDILRGDTDIEDLILGYRLPEALRFKLAKDGSIRWDRVVSHTRGKGTGSEGPLCTRCSAQCDVEGDEADREQIG